MDNIRVQIQCTNILKITYRCAENKQLNAERKLAKRHSQIADNIKNTIQTLCR